MKGNIERRYPQISSAYISKRPLNHVFVDHTQRNLVKAKDHSWTGVAVQDRICDL